MSYTLVWGAELLTYNSAAGRVIAVDNGALVEKDGIILEVGGKEELKLHHPDAEELGSSNCMVLPGFVNAHHHGKGVSNFQLGTLDEGLELWILELRKQREVDPYLDTLLAAIKQIETGVTTVVHSYYRRDYSGYERELSESLKAYLQSGLRLALSIGIKDTNTYVYQENEEFIKSLPQDLVEALRKDMNEMGEVSQEEYFSVVEKFFENYNGKDARLGIMLGPVGPQWCSDELLVKIRETADKLKTGLHFHILESVYQGEYYWKRYGKSLIAHINELGLLGPDVSCAHAVWVKEEDVELLAGARTSLVHNPSSNLRLKSGVMPLSLIVSGGVNVGLGTDGMSLNDDEDFIQEMRLCHKLHRLPGLDSFSITGDDVFCMATVNGARAALLEERTGSLEKGKAADVVLLRKDRLVEPFMEQGMSPLDSLIFRGKGSDVETVMVGGKVLMRDKRITSVDKHEIVERLKKNLREGTGGKGRESQELIDRLKPYILKFYREWQPGRPNHRYVYNTEV